MAGAMAGTKNRRRALSIPIQTADRLTRTSSGIIQRVRRTVRATLAASPPKSAEIASTTWGANTPPSRDKAPVTTSTPPRTRLPRAWAPAAPSRSRRAVKVGTNALDRAPSANRSRNRLGIRKATW